LKKELQQKIVAGIKSRFESYEQIVELYVASFLDPRFRTFNFISNPTKRKTALQKVFNYLKHERMFVKFQTINKQSNNTTVYQSTSTTKKFSIFDTPSSNYEQLELDDEIANYTNMNIVFSEDSNTLDFWKIHSNQYPILSTICKKIFSIPCTSVPSERLFSKSGEIISLKRNKLKPELAEYLTILDQDINF
jgi:hypothetical protein